MATGKAFRRRTIWGNILEPDPTGEEVGFPEINWHDTSDLSGLGG